MMPRCHQAPPTIPLGAVAQAPRWEVALRPAHVRAARARARARRRSAGAAMFIVAVTLGLLAAMGVYGLSATAYDIRAAGHGRAAAQVQHTAEHLGVMRRDGTFRGLQLDGGADLLVRVGIRNVFEGWRGGTPWPAKKGGHPAEWLLDPGNDVEGHECRGTGQSKRAHPRRRA